MFLRQLQFLIRKEFLTTLKDPKTRAILIVPVFVQSMIFGYVATYDLDRVPYALLDMDRSRASTEFVARLDGSTAFERVRTIMNATEIADCIDSGDAMLVVSIPQEFERELSSGRTATIQVITDGRNSMTASLASGYIDKAQYDMVSAFLGNAFESMRDFLIDHPGYLDETIAEGGKNADRARICKENDLYKLF